MTTLDVMKTVLRRIDDPDATIRIEYDHQLSADHCRIIVLTGGLWIAGVAEPTDWADPNKLVDAIVSHVTAERLATSMNSVGVVTGPKAGA